MQRLVSLEQRCSKAAQPVTRLHRRKLATFHERCLNRVLQCQLCEPVPRVVLCRNQPSTSGIGGAGDNGLPSDSRAPPGDSVQQPSSSAHDSESDQQRSSQNSQPDLDQDIKTKPAVPQVPWGVGKIVQVMVLWLLAYIIIGQVAVPITLSLLGLDRDELSIRGHALLHLCLDLSQLGVTLIILWRCLREFKPLKLGLFPVRLRGMWPLLVLVCCLIFPGVDWIAQQSMNWFPTDADQWANQMEHSLSIGDWITNVAYFCVVSICAPIWEEAIFRGFLLASLARYMPVGSAMLASSVLFAMCHFRLQTFLPLLILGVVFSSIFLFTRNLLPPIILHSAWNIFVLFNLLFRPA